MRFLGNTGVLFLTVLVSCVPALAGVNDWAEGDCKRSQDGANREYFNSGLGLKWRNYLVGDWHDIDNTPQGSVPFAAVAIADEDREKAIEMDVTSLVSSWTRGVYPNQGLLLRSAGGSALIFAKEYQDGSSGAKLKITTTSGQFDIPVSADTMLNASTHTCSGHREKLGTSSTVLMRFPLDSVRGTVRKARLVIQLGNKQYGDSTLDVYRASPAAPHYTFNTPARGISSSYPNDFKIENDPRVLLATTFESPDWGQGWSYGSDKQSLSLVKENASEGFVPLAGQALQANLPRGQLTALNLAYLLKDKLGHEPNSAYFRYYIRFGNNWKTIEGGKLPGFAGNYDGTPYEGGWGGRTSNGTNGWSARGFFKPVIQGNNPMADHVPIGTYLYHADMKSTYGDGIIWDGDGLGALERNRWYAIEQYIKLNTPGENDGVFRAWIDGKLAFQRKDLRFRNKGHGHIGLEKVWMNIYHGGTRPNNRTVNVYLDNIVIANEYIGPAVFDPSLPSAATRQSNSPSIVGH